MTLRPIPPRIAYPIGWFFLGANVGTAWYGAVLGRWGGVVSALIGVLGAVLLLLSTRAIERARDKA